MKTNQRNMINISIIGTVGTLVANYLVHIKLMYRFLYSAIINMMVFIFMILIDYYIYAYYNNFTKVCGIIINYNNANASVDYINKNNAEEICITHESYYIYWFVSQSFLIFCKGFSIFLAFMAHKKILVKLAERNSVQNVSENMSIDEYKIDEEKEDGIKED